MTPRKRLRGPVMQAALLALSLLALVIRVGVPPGFMADPTGGAGLVLCTGHGPAQSGPIKPGDQGKAAAASDMPCAFAGQAAAPAPEAIGPPKSVTWRAAHAGAVAWRDQAPGRGLAAPPPPALGPPTLI
jgi:hypothetical protein